MINTSLVIFTVEDEQIVGRFGQRVRIRDGHSLFFLSFSLLSLQPSAMSTLQENSPKLVACFDSYMPARRANYEFVCLNVNLGRGIITIYPFEMMFRPNDLFVWKPGCQVPNDLQKIGK